MNKCFVTHVLKLPGKFLRHPLRPKSFRKPQLFESFGSLERVKTHFQLAPGFSVEFPLTLLWQVLAPQIPCNWTVAHLNVFSIHNIIIRLFNQFQYQTSKASPSPLNAMSKIERQ